MLLVLISIIFIVQSCYCPTNPVFPVPDKIKYSETHISNMHTAIVKDTITPKIDTKGPDTTLAKLIYPQLEVLFDQERIQTIDFKDNLTATVQLYSNGNIIKTYDTDYTPFSDGIDMIGTLDNNYITLHVNSIKSATIPYYISYYKKAGSQQLSSGFNKHTEYAYDNIYSIMESMIRSYDLKVNDTIYVNEVYLNYVKY